MFFSIYILWIYIGVADVILVVFPPITSTNSRIRGSTAPESKLTVHRNLTISVPTAPLLC